MIQIRHRNRRLGTYAVGFDGVDDILLVNAAGATTYPFTMAGWALTTSATAFQTIMALVNSTANEYHVLAFRGDAVGDPITYNCAGGGGEDFADSSAGYKTSTWHHVCMAGRSSTLRHVYLDGTNRGAQTGSRSPSGINRTEIGEFSTSIFTGSNLTGLVAEVGLWNIGLTDAEVLWLAQGGDPAILHPNHLVGYWISSRTIDATRDMSRNTNTMTPTGTYIARGPEVWIPAPIESLFMPAAAPSTLPFDEESWFPIMAAPDDRTVSVWG